MRWKNWNGVVFPAIYWNKYCKTRNKCCLNAME